MTLEEWSAMLLYLDGSPDRVKVKNRVKAALGMKPMDKLQSLLPAKQVAFVIELTKIAKAEGVEIAF